MSVLQGWITPGEVFRPLLKLNRSPGEPDIQLSRKAVQKVQPLSVDRGDCLFEATGKLRFFRGARGGASDKVLMESVALIATRRVPHECSVPEASPG